MNKSFWSQYQAGQAGSVLPAGFMQAATEPGRALANGLGNFGMQMAQGFREMKEREERQKEEADKAKKEAQEAKQEFNRLVEKLSDGTKTTRDRLQTMGIGELQGLEARQEMERQQMAEAQRTAIMQENLNLAKDAALMRQQVFEQGQRQQADTADILRFAAVGRGIGLTDEDILAAAASGQSSFRNADLPTLLGFLQQTTPTRPEEPRFFSDPESGARVATYGKTIMDMTPKERDKEIGKFTQFKDPGTGRVLENVFVDGAGKVVDLRQTEDVRDLMLREFLNERLGVAAPDAAATGGGNVRRRFDMGDYAVEELSMPRN